jgi:hypothetical protein
MKIKTRLIGIPHGHGPHMGLSVRRSSYPGRRVFVRELDNFVDCFHANTPFPENETDIFRLCVEGTAITGIISFKI